jgi:hypothetical protein
VVVIIVIKDTVGAIVVKRMLLFLSNTISVVATSYEKNFNTSKAV